MPNQNLDQRRGKHASELIQRVLQLDEQKRKKFGRHAKKLPIRTRASGLGQALVFIHSKGDAPHLLEGLSDWVLAKRTDPNRPAPTSADRALIQRIINSDSDFLRRATDETMAYLVWLNRFADAEGLTDELE